MSWVWNSGLIRFSSSTESLLAFTVSCRLGVGLSVSLNVARVITLLRNQQSAKLAAAIRLTTSSQSVGISSAVFLSCSEGVNCTTRWLWSILALALAPALPLPDLRMVCTGLPLNCCNNIVSPTLWFPPADSSTSWLASVVMRSVPKGADSGLAASGFTHCSIQRLSSSINSGRAGLRCSARWIKSNSR